MDLNCHKIAQSKKNVSSFTALSLLIIYCFKIFEIIIPIEKYLNFKTIKTFKLYFIISKILIPNKNKMSSQSDKKNLVKYSDINIKETKKHI